MGIIQNAFFQQQTSLTDGEACGVGLAGCVGTGTKRGYIGILTGNHMHLIQADTHYIGCHLGISRICTLTDFSLTQLVPAGTILV